eukprot:PhF_6_TR4786/c0_g1_i3/m.6603
MYRSWCSVVTSCNGKRCASTHWSNPRTEMEDLPPSITNTPPLRSEKQSCHNNNTKSSRHRQFTIGLESISPEDTYEFSQEEFDTLTVSNPNTLLYGTQIREIQTPVRLLPRPAPPPSRKSIIGASVKTGPDESL